MSRKGMAVINKHGEYLSAKSTERLAIWTKDIDKAMIWTVPEAMMDYIERKHIKDYGVVSITTTTELVAEKKTIGDVYK